ncbi:prenyltransferase/squalene oxidase repeat-containing protein [Aureliella helgolandensis]|uniref:Squalene cyclase C-terminal domain-containing protein n=1 Tax=Aureliella helgolandensis TaxID=2527968 RepID=A0A518G2K6_9BACT|nr:prenyltransferase/squalene oxidase repeat-containing protein [Aureliella helgolandensis]QDV22779.1 hypothetical protein Q31a_10700 [Aureliella helgolandensis]
MDYPELSETSPRSAETRRTRGEASPSSEIPHSWHPTEEFEQQRATALRRRFFWTAAPSWLISLLIHVALILILAAITLEPVQKVISILQASSGGDAVALEEFDLQSPDMDLQAQPLDEPLSAPPPPMSDSAPLPEFTAPPPPTIQPLAPSLELNAITESVMPSQMLSTSALAQMSSALNSRSSASKSEMLERFGGSAASEKSVAMALRWLAQHQAPDGGWDFNHSRLCRNQCPDPGSKIYARNGATAMGLLPFLGAGQTHLEGQYKDTVKRGLSFLINRMQVTNETPPHGSWHEDGGTMYSHGLAAIAVCEAYAMTRDPDLIQPAQLAINYLVYAQDPRGGGWRYQPKSPGDTSVVGWCLMALKSGKMANLVVPPSTFRGTSNFLDFVSTNNGAYYGYEEPTSEIDSRKSTIAVGLLCRMYMDWPKDHPGLQDGIKFLAAKGPQVDDLYFSYYATQVMRHQGGPLWDKWNQGMRDALIQAQATEGHAAGSWYTGGPHATAGGRLAATSFATMILEVYYRHMPLYREKSANADDFEI